MASLYEVTSSCFSNVPSHVPRSVLRRPIHLYSSWTQQLSTRNRQQWSQVCK